MNAPRRRGRPSFRSTDPARVLAAFADPAVRRPALQGLVAVLQRARAGALHPDPERGQRDEHSLVAVAAARALSDEVDRLWPILVRDAVGLGAAVADVAAVSGLDEDLVAAMARDEVTS